MRSMDLDLLFLDVLIKSTSRHVQVFTIFPSFIMASIKSKPATKNDLDKLEKKLNLKIEAFKNEIIRHFDVVLEQIRHDAMGANRDETELIKDKQSNHEIRIKRLERRAGLIVV